MPLREPLTLIACSFALAAMDVSMSKSNIRELIRQKTMGHQSANDRITRHRVLFGAHQTQHTFGKM